MRGLVFLLFRLWVRVAAGIYGGEGINVPLMFMPTQLMSSILRAYGAQIGERVRFRSPLTVHNSDVISSNYYKHLSVGNDCYFGRELFLDLQDRIVIENNVTVSHRVMILTHTDAGPSPLQDLGVSTSRAPVTIRQGAYIGAQATILQGVEIGEYAVVGANALVKKPVPPQSVAVGVPARVVKILQEAEKWSPEEAVSEIR